MDITVTNDYTRDSMLKGCDEVIDVINKLFGTRVIDKKAFDRKSDRDLFKELGVSRIEEGSSRVQNCELFNPHILDDFEK